MNPETAYEHYVQNIKLASFYRYSMTLDEAKSNLYMCILTYCDGYDPSLASFSTYLNTRFKAYQLYQIRCKTEVVHVPRSRRSTPSQSFTTSIHTEVSDTSTLSDMLGEEDPSYSQFENREMIDYLHRKCLTKYPQKAKMISNMFAGKYLESYDGDYKTFDALKPVKAYARGLK